VQRGWRIRGVRHIREVGETLLVFRANELQKGQELCRCLGARKEILEEVPQSNSFDMLFVNTCIYIYLSIHPCRKMHTQSDLLISVRVIQEMGKYDHPFAQKVGQGWSHDADFSRIPPFFVYVCNSDSIFLGEANFDIF
jgi:hypothetical protein